MLKPRAGPDIMSLVMDHEEALIRGFVLRTRRQRVLALLRNAKRRRKALNTLYHFRDLDPRYLVDIPPSDQGVGSIAALLAQRGAPDTCHIISTNQDLDGRALPLVEALEQIVGSGDGTLLSCVPGQLGYFEGEGPGDRFILARASSHGDTRPDRG
jgi:hypothetical protein